MPLVPWGGKGRLFTPAWIEAVAGVVEMGHEAEVRLISRTREGPIDPTTGRKTEVITEHWSGTARIQPMQNPTYEPASAGDTLYKRVRVQMSRVGMRVDMGWELEVTRCDHNPSLETYRFTDMETVNSSNPTDTTLMFQVNPKEKM